MGNAQETTPGEKGVGETESRETGAEKMPAVETAPAPEPIGGGTTFDEIVRKNSQSGGPIAAPADADTANWVDRFAPDMTKPYLRLMRADRPIGTWLLAIPCWWGLALAVAQTTAQSGAQSGAQPLAVWAGVVWYAALFAAGAFVMRGAGCAYNDIIDRDIDGKVERTARRPIPSGQITVGAAAAFMAFLCLIGLVVLVQFNRPTVTLGVASLILVAAYPFAKRVTYWPQAWLGLTFNWGALLGYVAIAGALTWPAFLLYAAGVAWTVGYDTIYAHQDKEDDALIGVKSTALRFGDQTRGWLIRLFGAVIALFITVGALSGFSVLYFIALSLPTAHFLMQLRRLDTENPALCLEIFKSNRNAGLLLLAPLLLEAIIFAPYFGV